jgi:hypothetical protein
VILKENIKKNSFQKNCVKIIRRFVLENFGTFGTGWRGRNFFVCGEEDEPQDVWRCASI